MMELGECAYLFRIGATTLATLLVECTMSSLCAGPEVVFRDIDDIPLGSDYPAALAHQFEVCSTALVLIGPRWLRLRADGRRRIDLPTDMVRLRSRWRSAGGWPSYPCSLTVRRCREVTNCLPRFKSCPDRNAIALRDDPDFHVDMARLVRGILSGEDGRGTPRFGSGLRSSGRERSAAANGGAEEVGEPRVLGRHPAVVFGCAVSPYGGWVVSASADATLRVWEVASGRVVRVLSGHERPVFGCAVSPDGGWVVSASADATLRVWEVASGRVVGVVWS